MAENQIQSDISVQQKQSPLKTLADVFAAPARAFEYVKQYPTWFFPVSLTILVSVIFLVATKDIMIDFQRQSIYDNAIIPEQYKDKAIEDLENKSDMRFYVESVAGSVVSIAISYLVATGAIMLFGNFIFGGMASFKLNFAMFSWAGVIGIAESLVKMVLILAKGSMLVYTSPAILLDVSEKSTAWFQFLDAFDIFVIWRIIVLATGFGIIYKFSKAKSYTAIIVLYAIYQAMKIGISQLF